MVFIYVKTLIILMLFSEQTRGRYVVDALVSKELVHLANESRNKRLCS